MSEHDERWLRAATELALTAIEQGEVPIASIVVAGEREISRSITEVLRSGSIVCHGEIAALRQAGSVVWSADRPLVVYTNLEPCLMCIGAAMQAGVDEIVYSMRAVPDGGACAAALLKEAGECPVVVRQAGDDSASRSQFENYLRVQPEASGADYVRRLLSEVRSPSR